MRLIRGLTGLRRPAPRCVLTVGAYDGLHLGHQALIARLLQRSAELGQPSVLLSFEPLPREFLQPQNPPARLTSFRERWRILTPFQIDWLCLLRFNEALRNLPGEAFAGLLAQQLGVSAVIVGHDFRFGRQGEAGSEALIEAGRRLGYSVDVLEPVTYGDERISSSGIRAALAAGDFERAQRWLGRPWSMRGRVATGQRLGRNLGFPTLNLRLERRHSPVYGVFAVRVHGIRAQCLPGVASLGTRPTIGGGEALLEAHVFDFAGELYGREVEVEFVAKLRDEAHFASVAALTEQMQCDALAARRILHA